MKNIFFSILMTPIVLFSLENKTIESQPQILFEHQNLQDKQERRELLLKFNTAVLYLEQEKYMHAIQLLKQSSKILKVPSYLNIGIAYYKLNSENNAYLYLKKIYDFKELQYKDKYSYFSAAYYLYKITNNEEYIKEITNVSQKAKRLTEHEKLLVVDTLILQKKYQEAFELAEGTKNISQLKVAMLCIKLGNYDKAKFYLEKAHNEAKGDKAINEVMWFKLFRNIKANDISSINDNIATIDERKKIFHTNNDLGLELFFNKDKFTAKEYFDKITNPSFDLKLDFAYYFAPFIFEDYDAMNINETNGFIIKNKDSIHELNMMIDYNSKFLKVIKEDPIKRVQTLQKMIDEKYDTKAYEYYNLGLSYAQIYDYNNAYKYFKKAYTLDHGNKLYSVMTFITTKKFNVSEDKVFLEFLEKNILAKSGSYEYLATYMYKIFIDSTRKLDNTKLSLSQKKSIFFRALHFIENLKSDGIMENAPLLVEFDKDPLVHLFNLIAREEDENMYLYISRIQDELPKVYNNMFLNGNLVITDYYIDTVKALGIFNRIDFNITNNKNPAYLRTKAIIQLYNENPKETIKIIEHLQNEYNLQSIDAFYLMIAALFSSGQDELAYATLTEIEFLYKDKDAKFLSGIRMIQDMKLSSAVQNFRDKMQGKLIDIRLENFDDFLEEL
ncbi:MAG: hypothetical protein WA945_00215 [Arcobacteraceae bacterium]